MNLLFIACACVNTSVLHVKMIYIHLYPKPYQYQSIGTQLGVLCPSTDEWLEMPLFWSKRRLNVAKQLKKIWEQRCRTILAVKDNLVLYRHKNIIFCFPPEHHVPGWGEGPDQEDTHRPDGHLPNERAWEGPGDVGGPAVQPRQLLRQHPRAQTHLAREHGQDPC